MRTTKILASVAGGNIQITPTELGYALAETNRSVQLFVKGLDGGSYAVLVKPVDNETFFVYEPAVTEQDLVTIPASTLCYNEILIQFVALGAAAQPKCTITSFTKF